MSSAVDALLRRLEEEKIHLWVEDDKLRFRAPAGALTAELKAELRTRKGEILALLGRPRSSAIERLSAQEHYDLSQAQRRLWVLSQLEDGSEAYNLPLRLLLRGDLDRSALDRAFRRIVERHESLRTTFISVDGTPRQKVGDPSAFQVQWRDLSDARDPAAAVRAMGREENHTAFDLERGPLFRVTVARLGARRHALFVTMHHIVSDGWSLSVLLREVSLLYQAFQRGAPDPLPPLGIQYRDYARWQNRALEGARAAALRAYWLGKLSGKVERLHLPTDFPRPPRQTFRGNMRAVPLGEPRTRALHAFAREQLASLFMVLVALVKALLYRYTRQANIIVGTPTAGRNHEALSDQIGFYLNTLVLLDELRGDQPFEELLGAVRKTALAAYEHQDYPFNQLLDDLRLERDLSHNPVFDVMVMLQNAGKLELELPGIELEPLFQEPGTSKLDLTFDFEELESHLLLGIRYNTDLFSEARITRLADHFLALVDSALAHPRKPIAALDILPASERQRVLFGFNATGAPVSERASIVDLFARKAASAPARAAVFAADGSSTYGELDARSSRIALFLRGSGASRPEEKVGLLMPRSSWLPAGMLGVLKAGAAYLPMEITHPPARLAQIIRASGCALVLTQGEPPRELSGLLEGVRFIDIEAAAQRGASGTAVGARIDPAQAAYVIYTSGTTGEPKGVVVTHGNVVNFLESMRQRPGCGPEDTLLSVTTPSFDIFGLEVFLPLATGARLVLADRDTITDGRKLTEMLDAEGVTMMQATPAAWKILLDDGWRGGGKGGARLKMLCGGEALSKPLAERLLETGGELWNLYGPTETTIWSSAGKVGDAEVITAIGRPIANTQIYILDEDLSPVPVGLAGEIMIAGEGLARGYWSAPALTAERFLPNPFAEGQRIYRTGDRGRWLPSGAIECLGRMDESQVKVRGFRIETSEIELHLLAHPEIKDAAVVARDTSDDGKELVAYLVSAADLDAAELRARLGRALPAYMIPRHIVRLDSLPLNRSGKVDRKALRSAAVGAGNTAGAAEASGREAPRDELERRLVEIWREVLAVDSVGIHDNFFDLGGHSLKATALASRVRRRLEADMALSDVFSAPTVASLAARLRGKAPTAFISIRKIPDAPRYPVSRAQKRLWVLCQERAASVAYNMPAPLLLEGELHEAALEAALRQTIERHESLRTTLVVEDGIPWQHVRATADFNLLRVDMSGAASPDAEASAFVNRDLLEPFDLEAGPLLRAALLRLGPRRHVLALSMHHIIADAWSLRVMARELAALYLLALGEAVPELPPLRLQYRDYTAWQAELDGHDVLSAQREYWLKKLAPPIPDCRLRTDFPRPREQTFAGDRLHGLLPAELVARLRELGRQQRGGLFAVLHTAVKCLIYRYTGREDIIVGCTAAGRSHPDLEGQIGFYVNTLALRDRLQGTASFESILRQVSQTTAEGYERQDYPFDRLVEELSTAEGRRAPLFDVLLDYYVDDDEQSSLAGLDVSVFKSQPPIAKFDIVFSFALERGELRILVMYNVDLYRRGRVEQMIVHFREILQAAASEPACPVIHLPLSGVAAGAAWRAASPPDDALEQFNF